MLLKDDFDNSVNRCSDNKFKTNNYRINPNNKNKNTRTLI